MLENASVLPGDYMSPNPLPQGQVEGLFEQLKALELAVEGVQNTLHMEACDKTGTAEPGKTAHKMWLSGTFAGGISVIAKALIGLHQGRILMQLDVASKNPQVAELCTQFFNL